MLHLVCTVCVGMGIVCVVCVVSYWVFVVSVCVCCSMLVLPLPLSVFSLPLFLSHSSLLRPLPLSSLSSTLSPSPLQIVHRALCCKNVLVGAGLEIKINNVGGFDLPDEVRSPLAKWFAPEVLNGENFSIGSDVWAFGVTLWEIITVGE